MSQARAERQRKEDGRDQPKGLPGHRLSSDPGKEHIPFGLNGNIIVVIRSW